jgi:uncharacterized RDD family membrane protein YckC
VYPVPRMKVKQYRWAFIGAFAAFVILAFVSQLPTMGASAEWNNGRYRFAGGTTPWALAYALLVIGLYISLMYASPSDEGPTLPGVIRRFVAFWLDFMLAMFALAPILGILPTITEWRRTGVFAWNFERTTPTPSDMLLASIILVLCSVSLVLYFALPLIRRRPSPGGCIVGYQIVPDEGITLTFRMAVLRTLLGFIAVCSAYLAPFIARDRKKGKFWLDKVFGTRAITLN